MPAMPSAGQFVPCTACWITVVVVVVVATVVVEVVVDVVVVVRRTVVVVVDRGRVVVVVGRRFTVVVVVARRFLAMLASWAVAEATGMARRTRTSRAANDEVLAWGGTVGGAAPGDKTPPVGKSH
ncbi:MAG: hypothetical protein JWO68_3929 [Actinomycetia bacterium]|nr:hypothetical protein [Actinomycetes bacterium]